MSGPRDHDIDDYAQEVLAALTKRLAGTGIKEWPADDRIYFTLGTDLVGQPRFKLGDLDSLLEDFMTFMAPADYLGDAIAAMALNHLSVQHDVPMHGITLAFCGAAA